VSTWSVFGGSQPVTSLSASQFAALRSSPADGSFVSANGFVYRFAGGAPLYVSSWAAVGGSAPATQIDPAAIANADAGGAWNHVHRYPADGTFVNTGAGYVYRFAGGAPLYVSSWASVGGSQPSTRIDQSAIDNADGGSPWDHVRRYPADGTFIGTSGGYVYRFAGGAPLYVSTWASVGGAQPATGIDQAAVDNADGGAPWNHIRKYPADGTLVNTSTGVVYRFAGGAPLFVSTWASIGGSQPSTRVDQAVIDNGDAVVPWNHVHGLPVDGTFLTTSAGSYRVAGGYPFTVTDPSAFPAHAATLVDSWVITNRGSVPSHLLSVAKNGTIVVGVPSAQQWSISSGCRVATSGMTLAVPQNDAGITLVAECPPPPPPVDTTAPTVTASAVPVATLKATQAFSWGGSDAGTGVVNYDARLSSSTYATALSTWAYPSAWQRTTSQSVTVSLALGRNYCVQVRSRDGAGNASGWSPSRCVARALDDRALTPSAAFLRKTGTGFYNGTYTSTATLSATVVRTGAHLDRVGIVATKCSTCGIVGVYVSGVLIGKVNLYSATMKRQQVLLLPRFSMRTGTVTVKVLSSGKAVQMDGLLISST
jgi:hypothetical protein